MRMFVLLGAALVVVPIAMGCGTSHAVEVRLVSPSYGTTGGNLFNCTTPDFPADQTTVDESVIACTPQPGANGTLSTTPVLVLAQVACSDGHGAVVTVSCAGTGTGHDITTTVTLSITPSCGSHDPGSDPQSFTFADVAPADTQATPATLSSCAVFDNICPTTNECAFNAFSATVSVTNMTL